MLLIPQMFLKNNQAARLGTIPAATFNEDPIAMAHVLKGAGAEAVHIVDLAIPPMGESPHLSLIKKIHDDVGLAVYVGGLFRSTQAMEPFAKAGCELIYLGTVAYQEPQLLKEACLKYPAKIAAPIDVKGGRVTIPGWAVAANLTASDYAERFQKAGVGTLFYSDVNSDGRLTSDQFQTTLNFCKLARSRIIITSEIAGLPDIESFVILGAPRLEGLVLGKVFSTAGIDLKVAIAMVSDLMLSAGNEPTMTEG